MPPLEILVRRTADGWSAVSLDPRQGSVSGDPRVVLLTVAEWMDVAVDVELVPRLEPSRPSTLIQRLLDRLLGPKIPPTKAYPDEPCR